ncbi:alanine--tRNA ligase [Mycoplasma sp. 3686d]|uniref:alanine--tRNA ligase n=1 Tax=Mycoplasma sp. 3686d TaxID=2967300 RepID=UPI00211BA04E|nr:alanine--tRNA ligase [Mycoplasma sp. 3686d]UUM24614.1 alanine--tRNA ligase [Mycoplasma sp. 3686d]
MKTSEIRDRWLKFFESKGHFIVPSKSLVPEKDPSLLWINSGVATLKDYFSGKKIPPSKRLTNSQKAIRTNDIENVGITARHHTFFEMLGNFSIGDYFKKEAIAFAVEFLVNDLKLDRDKLYFTYYYEDLETKNEWMSHGFSEDRLIPGDKSTNFWEVGSGPCGPNTEIFYDRGEKYDSRGIELLQKDIENDRYIEIWNIVFSTYNSDGEGNYTELNQKNIDTGAGLERIASILQDTPTNFDTDLFLPIIHEIEKYTPYKYQVDNYFINDSQQSTINTYFKVIADHMRTVVNAINDGAKPSNVGRGYILRRLIRRSVHKAMQLKVEQNIFLYKLVAVIASTLPYEYNIPHIEKVILEEEILFSKTIESGRELLEQYINHDQSLFSGVIAFRLFETYGFPIELTTEILAEQNIQVDMNGYNRAKEQHSEVSKGSKIAGMDKVINSLSLIDQKLDKFIGYDFEEGSTKVLKILTSEHELSENEGISYLILEQTPFYATSGGQKHDRGYIIQGKNRLEILNVFKDKFNNHIHKVQGKVNLKDPVQCFVDKQIRLGLKRNHSGTHLLFCALRTILGPHIEQLSSDNNELRLTFDFPADQKPSKETIAQIENLVKDYIKRDAKRNYLQTTTEKAKQMGAIMTLEEAEYMDPKNIRIVEFEGITADLCGGTHLEHSGMLETFKIVSVEKKAAGIFRIRAISSFKIVNEYLNEQVELLTEQFDKIIVKNEALDPNYQAKSCVENDLEKQIQCLEQAIEQAKEDNKTLSKKQAQNSNSLNLENLQSTQVNGKEVYVLELPISSLKTSVSTIREAHTQALVIGYDQSNMLCVGSKTLNANQIAQQLFKFFQGKGGGNNLLAMGKCILTVSKEIILEQLTKISWEN